MVMRSIDIWATTNADDLDRLMRHFEEKGKPMASVDDLMVEMLCDVIDIWTEAHLGSMDEGCEQ